MNKVVFASALFISIFSFSCSETPNEATEAEVSVEETATKPADEKASEAETQVIEEAEIELKKAQEETENALNELDNL